MVCLILAVMWVGYERTFARPRYVFANFTANHEHDLALKTSLKIAEMRAGIENALILLDRLPPGMKIEEAAHRIFDKFRIGQRTGGKGILYLYSQQENLFKIEVSYALEGVIPDAVCHHLEQAAQSYMLSEIPEDYLVELMVTLNIHSKEMGAEDERAYGAPEWMKDYHLSGGAGARSEVHDPSYQDYRDAIRRMPEDSYDGDEPGDSPEKTVKAYLRSLENGLGDPRMDFLTEGSRVFRVAVPRGAAQQRRIFQYYRKAMPYRIIERGPLALAVFRVGVPNLPIVLRRMPDGLWYVDEPKAWSWFDRYEDGDDFFVKSYSTPFYPELLAVHHPGALGCKYGDRLTTPPLPPEGVGLDDYIEERERGVYRDPLNAKAYAELGDAYFHETGSVLKALRAYKEASRLDPTNRSYRWQLVDLTLYAREYERQLHELWMLAYGHPLMDVVRFRLPLLDWEAVGWYHFLHNFIVPKAGEFRSLRAHEIL